MKGDSFSTLLDIDKLTHARLQRPEYLGFSTLLDIDKLTPDIPTNAVELVLVLCWILINLHAGYWKVRLSLVLVLCWILIMLL